MNGIDIERARRDAAVGSMVAKVALAVAHGQTWSWPAAFRDTAASLYAAKDPMPEPSTPQESDSGWDFDEINRGADKLRKIKAEQGTEAFLRAASDLAGEADRA